MSFGAESAPSRGQRWFLAVSVVVLLGLLVAAHRVAFRAPFYFDSALHLVEKSNLHLVRIDLPSLQAAMRHDYGQAIDRPLSRLTLAFTYYFARLSPPAYRWGNLAIHCLAAVALFFLFTGVLRSPRVRRAHTLQGPDVLFVALGGVALWALHPIQTNVVTYVIQRMASLSGLFSFLSVGCYLRARMDPDRFSWKWLATSAVALLGGLASKENSIAVLPVLLLCEGLLLDPPTDARSRRRLVASGVLVAFAAAAILACVLPGLLETQAGLYKKLGMSFAAHMWTSLSLQSRYVLLLLVPDPRLLTVDGQVEIISSLLTSTLVLGTAAALALVVLLAVRLWRRAPLVSFGVGWYLITQVIEVVLLPQDLYFEHRLYVPSVFLFLGLAWLLTQPMRLARPSRLAAALLMVAMCCAENYATAVRNQIWRHPVLLWADAVAKAPTKVRPLINFGTALLGIGKEKEGREVLERALKLGGPDRTIYYNFGILSYRSGDSRKARLWMEKALSAPGDESPLMIHRFLTLEALEKGDLDRAESQVAQALRAKPDDATTLNLKGRLLFARGKLEEAERTVRTALRYDPSLPQAMNTLGKTLAAEGRREEAQHWLREAVRVDPRQAAFREDLARVSSGATAP